MMNDNNQLDTEVIKSYLELFLAFQKLPRSRRDKTFMEVSGYPHYENVASNILAFYFDPSAEHGLKTLFLAAFLQMTGNDDFPACENVKIYREWATDERKRIDIIVDSDDVTIGIENKIFHWLANDLNGYSQVIDQLGRNKKVVKVVLGLHMITTEQCGTDFISFTYEQLWTHVRNILGNYISNANPKWVTYLIDFMNTTSNLAGRNMEEKQLDQFFVEHNELIEDMIGKRNEFMGRLSEKIASLCELMSEAHLEGLSKPPWIYANCCVVLDFMFLNQFGIAFDTYLNPSGWEIQLFGRNAKTDRYLQKLLQHQAFNGKIDNIPLVNSRYILKKLPVQTELDIIKSELCSWVNILLFAVTPMQPASLIHDAQNTSTT